MRCRSWFRVLAMSVFPLCLLGLAGCAATASVLRWMADAAEDPATQQLAQAGLQAVGVPSWVAGLLGIGTLGGAAGTWLKGRQATRATTTLGALTGSLEGLKTTLSDPGQRDGLRRVLEAVSGAATEAGVGQWLDAFLARRGENQKPILRG